MRIELLRETTNSVIGEKSKSIVDLLYQKKNVNEFVLAKKMGLTINQTRNLLYKLADEGLVSVIRKKNKKKGGWYDHFWTLSLEKSLLKRKESISKKIEFLKQQIQTKKNNRFYVCETCGFELDEEHALLQEYTCIECGQLLGLKDNLKFISSLEKEITKLERDLQEVNAELEIINKKNTKAREKKDRIEEQKKSKERAARRKKLKRTRNLLKKRASTRKVAQKRHKKEYKKFRKKFGKFFKK
jgi:transcription factor E